MAYVVNARCRRKNVAFAENTWTARLDVTDLRGFENLGSI